MQRSLRAAEHRKDLSGLLLYTCSLNFPPTWRSSQEIQQSLVDFGSFFSCFTFINLRCIIIPWCLLETNVVWPLKHREASVSSYLVICLFMPGHNTLLSVLSFIGELDIQACVLPQISKEHKNNNPGLWIEFIKFQYH